MAKSSFNKVLLLTNFFGFLQIIPDPERNVAYYQNHNMNNPADKQFSWKEMSADAAQKFVEDNGGIDPDFTTPTQAVQAAKQSKETIARLQEEHQTVLESKDAEIEKLRALLNQSSQAPTLPGAPAAVPLPENAPANTQSTEANTSTSKPNATDVVAKIQAATSADEVNKLIDGDDRKTVKDAATKKLQEFGS